MKRRTLTLCLSLSLAAALASTGCDRKQPAAAKPDATNIVAAEKRAEGEWCEEHGVPESVCTRCHPNLIASFKQKGDWCKEHNLPESQCVQCDPTLKEKLEAMKPKK